MMNTQNLQPIYIATVTEVVEGGVKLHFRGELAPRTKAYSVIGAMPSVNDRVAVAAVSGTYVVLGGGAGGSGGGFDPDDYLPKSGGTMTGPITTPNNAAGINVGDDARLADRNIANTMFLEGQQNTDRGYINFSQYSGNALGAVNGGNLTWRGSRVWDAAGLPYETGTWTPTLYGSTTAGTPTYFARDGSYTRIGNIVSLRARCYITNKGGMAGFIRISGIPFVPVEDAAGVVGAQSGYAAAQITLHIDAGSNYIALRRLDYLLDVSEVTSESFGFWSMLMIMKIA